MRINHLINGQQVASRDYFETVNPATQEVLAEVASRRHRRRDPRRRGCRQSGLPEVGWPPAAPSAPR
jgi:5-carboxymethyl-2-hydroxymuconic-semialdehyde dehydrogenase